MNKGIFITATGTDTGKTYIACSLAKLLRKNGTNIGVMKPVACGSRADAVKLKKSAGVKDKLETINPVYLKYPLAPFVSAKLEKKKIDIKKLLAAYKSIYKKYDFMIIEGAGGVMVPVTADYYVADMIKDFKLPVVVVAGPELGTINHTVLTVEKLKKEKIKVLAVIINGGKNKNIAVKTNPAILRQLLKLPVIEVPYGKHVRLKDIKWIVN